MRYSTLLIFVFMDITIFQICFSKPSNQKPDLHSDYRTTYGQQMLSYMNRSVAPCEDFYEYACGNWKNVIEERYTETRRHNLFDLSYKFDDFIEGILQKTNIDDLAPEYADEFELTKKFYNNCIHTELYPMHKSSEYLEVLNQIGGFPAVNSSWISHNFSWLNMSAHMSNYGVVGFIKEHISEKYPHPPFFLLPAFGFDIELQHDNIVDTNTTYAYKHNYQRMHDILITYGVDEPRIEPIINDIFEFLKAAVNILKESDGECEKDVEKNEIADIVKLWQSYFEISWTNIDMPYKLEPCIYFYRHLNDICNKYKEAVANYLSLQFLYQMHARLTDNRFQKGYCLSELRQSMPYFFDHLYKKIIVKNETVDEAIIIAKEMRQSLRLVLQEADWLDEFSRNATLQKESSLADCIGRYENKNVMDRLIKEIKKLTFINGNYEKNNLNLKKFKQYMNRYECQYHKELSNATELLKTHLGMQTEAFYSSNNIYIFYGILQPPLFNTQWPNSLKFGKLGAFYGHELTHAFQSDTELSSKASKVFEEHSDCFVDYYGKYFVPEINRYINGKNTRDENIVDVEGLRLAIKAYRSYIKKLTNNFEPMSKLYKEEQMPGIDLSPEQLFFLGFAQLFCASYKEADYLKYINDVHGIDKYRALGSLSNNEDFAKAYNCPLGSKMNPSIDKCKLW